MLLVEVHRWCQTFEQRSSDEQIYTTSVVMYRTRICYGHTVSGTLSYGFPIDLTATTIIHQEVVEQSIERLRRLPTTARYGLLYREKWVRKPVILWLIRRVVCSSNKDNWDARKKSIRVRGSLAQTRSILRSALFWSQDFNLKITAIWLRQLTAVTSNKLWKKGQQK